jgi:ElaB/YqjD/DUF883 family membrane-anchored ribosome-binding protein
MVNKQSADEPTKGAAQANDVATLDQSESKDQDWRAQADEFAQQAKGAARNAANSAKATTGDALTGLSKLISDTAETVDSKLGPQYGDYARKAAEAVAGAAKSLDEKDIDQLTEEARTFVRKSPAVAIGAAAVVGFVLMRMMRGSRDDA